MPVVFPPFNVASSAKCLLFWHYCLSQISDNTDIFLNQLIQFYSNNPTNLHHKWRSYCNHRYMMSLHPMYILRRSMIMLNATTTSRFHWQETHWSAFLTAIPVSWSWACSKLTPNVTLTDSHLFCKLPLASRLSLLITFTFCLTGTPLHLPQEGSVPPKKKVYTEQLDRSLQAGCPSCHLPNSVNAVKENLPSFYTSTSGYATWFTAGGGGVQSTSLIMTSLMTS